METNPMQPEPEDVLADHQRAVEEMNWEALSMEADHGIRSQQEIELLFYYWFHHAHLAVSYPQTIAN